MPGSSDPEVVARGSDGRWSALTPSRWGRSSDPSLAGDDLGQADAIERVLFDCPCMNGRPIGLLEAGSVSAQQENAVIMKARNTLMKPMKAPWK